MIVLACLAVFAAAFALDFADARNKLAVNARDGHRAGLWSIAMKLSAVAGTFALVEVSWWLVIPECAGLYAGSRFALRKLPDLHRSPIGGISTSTPEHKSEP